MEDEKANVQEEVVEQEEVTTTDEVVEDKSDTTEEKPEEVEEETITISREKFKAMQKKAIDFDALKKAPQTKKEDKNINNESLADELKLIAKGISDEEIEQAKVIAKGKGISIIEATKDPLFISFSEDIKEKARKEKAKLGASHGSGSSKPEEIIKSGMSKEEHKKVWNEMMNK